MKTAISVPDELFKRGEAEAKRRRMARSTLYAEALREYLDRKAEHDITARLNAAYEKNPPGLDPGLLALQAATRLDEWK